MNRTIYDFDVVSGPVEPRPAAPQPFPGQAAATVRAGSTPAAPSDRARAGSHAEAD